ncbi:MAG: sigma-54-dependent Fis family transcriptional regulator, partial [Myxococcales bacterium]|nr:sigma-54-dependent Fis family transcriptional regulator [Myxococcales bacterium]
EEENARKLRRERTELERSVEDRMIALQSANRALQREANQLRDALRERQEAPKAGVVGQSKPFRELLDLIRQVAASPVAVLIIGQTGTGKSFTARLLHQWSPRGEAKFVIVKCGAMEEEALERELFGWVDEAGLHRGRLADADGGTLFLDEIGEMPLGLQAKLLHFLQDRSYAPVGGSERLSCDTRVITASNHDLDRLVRDGRFREDLYYRLNVVTLRTPTLRERRDDIPLLAMHFLRVYAHGSNKTITGFNERALGVLLNFDWPGNIRQLENCIERAVVLARSAEIEPRDLPRELMSRIGTDEQMPTIPGASLRELERFAILRTLEHVGGSTSKAAKILGISPRKIQYRLNEYRSTPQSGLPAVVSGSGKG